MELLHIIGLCPDSLSHVDLIDIFFVSAMGVYARTYIAHFYRKVMYVFKEKATQK